MKTIKKIGLISLWTILIISLIYNIYSYICLNLFQKDIVNLFGYAFLEVESGSMSPTIEVGDIIVIKLNNKHYTPNTIITFKDHYHSLVTHRIVDIQNNQIITKGDANDHTDDDYLTKDNIVGTYLFKINHLGYVIKSIKSPINMILIFIMGIIVCALISTDKNDQKTKKDK